MAEGQTQEKKLIVHDEAAFRQGAIPKNVATQEATPVAVPTATTTTTETEKPTEVPATPVTQAPEESEDEKELRAYNKRFKTSFASWDEVNESLAPPKEISAEEKEKIEKKEKADALEWKLKVDPDFKEVYDKAIADKEKSNRDIAFKVFKSEEKAKNKNITDDEIEELFKDEYSEEAPENSPRYVRALARMAKVAEDYKKQNYSSVDTYENEYKEYKGLETKAKNFGKQAKQVIDSLPGELTFEIPYTGADGKEDVMNIPFPIGEEGVKALRKEFMHENMFFNMGANVKPVTDDKLSEAAINHFQAKNFKAIYTHIAAEVMRRTELEVLARQKNVPNTNHLNGSKLPFESTVKELIKHPDIAFKRS